MQSWHIGVLLAILAGFLSNLGLNLQRLTHVRIAKHDDEQERSENKDKTPSIEEGLDSVTNSCSTIQETSAFEEGYASQVKFLPETQSGLSNASEYNKSSAAPTSNLHKSSSKYRLVRYASDLIPIPPFMRSPLWIFGFGLIILGSLADFLALMFASQTIVAPLGSLTLFFNTIFASVLFHEYLSKRQLLATLAILFGTIFTIMFAAHQKSFLISSQFIFHSLGSVPTLIYFGTILTLLIVFSLDSFPSFIMTIIRRFLPRKLEQDELSRLSPETNNSGVENGGVLSIFPSSSSSPTYIAFIYAAKAGIVGAQTVLFAKIVGQLILASFTSVPAFLYAILKWEFFLLLLILCITIFLQMRWLNFALQSQSSLFIVPIFQSFWILFSVVSGLIYFKEYEDMNRTEKVILFPLGIFITICGVIVLGRENFIVDANKDEDEANEPSPLSGVHSSETDPLIYLSPSHDLKVPVSSPQLASNHYYHSSRRSDSVPNSPVISFPSVLLLNEAYHHDTFPGLQHGRSLPPLDGHNPRRSGQQPINSNYRTFENSSKPPLTENLSSSLGIFANRSI